MTVASLLEEQPTADIIIVAKEIVDQMTQEITILQETYKKISTEIWNIVKGLKDDVGGLRTSNK